MAKDYERSCHDSYFNAAFFCNFSHFLPFLNFQLQFLVFFSHFLPFSQLHLNSRSEQGAATSLESNPTFIQCSCQRPNCTDDDKDVDRDGDDFDGDGESDSQAMHLQKLVCQGRKSQTSIFPPQKLQFVEPRKLRNFCSRI